MNTPVLVALLSVVIVCIATWYIYKFWKWVKTLFIILLFISLTASCSKTTIPADFRYEKQLHVKHHKPLKVYHCNRE